MKGYRCDTCHDFAAEDEKERTALWPLGSPAVTKVPPLKWIMVSDDTADRSLHFCSAGCVIAWAEQRGAKVPV